MRLTLTALLLLTATPALAQHRPSQAQVATIEHGLRPQSGDIALPQAGATLHLGKDFYFLDAAQARQVLTELWGNPPSTADGVLGLVMPAGKSVMDETWGAVVTFQDSGYVTDDDASTADYDKILTQLREGEAEENEQRRAQGYPGMHLMGWAQPPSYDRATHAVIWARDLKIDGASADSLNYDVRVLGRKGVLSLNMLWDMPHLAEVRTAAATFGRTAQFTSGQAYTDFDEAKGDKRAGYGLAGLVAAGVGVVAAKKLGLIALALGFGKKFLVLFAIAGAAISRFFKKLFGKKDEGRDAASS
ncbi:DUF2167 domain-containing protein [Sphingomonas sp.]|uniref:DUF2167 domain-containing protein n=1 Tax=Sphingomonas sp. TaxID=28214 RepID=UPI003B007D3C